MVEEMLAARGIGVSYETVRQWADKFGRTFSHQIRQRALSREPNLARAKIGSPNSGSGCGSSSPRLESFFSEDAERAAECEMALYVESVLDGGVNGQEALS